MDNISDGWLDFKMKWRLKNKRQKYDFIVEWVNTGAVALAGIVTATWFIISLAEEKPAYHFLALSIFSFVVMCAEYELRKGLKE